MSNTSVARPLSFAAVCLMAASVAFAAGPPRHPAAAPGTRVRPSRSAHPSTAGPALYTTTSVSALGFTPFNSGWTYASNPDDYFRYMTLSGTDFGASISIPAGAVIDYIGFSTCDAAGGNFAIFVYQQFADGTYATLGQFTNSAHGAAAPCGMDYNATALGYLLQENDGSSLQLDVVQELAAPTDGSVRFGSVELWWTPSVSAAPAMPTFNDVPASDFGFQYIEALAASGITGGCGGGNYCPDNPVTRRQMAIFLAKALGLAWPY